MLRFFTSTISFSSSIVWRGDGGLPNGAPGSDHQASSPLGAPILPQKRNFLFEKLTGCCVPPFAPEFCGPHALYAQRTHVLACCVVRRHLAHKKKYLVSPYLRRSRNGTDAQLADANESVRSETDGFWNADTTDTKASNR